MIHFVYAYLCDENQNMKNKIVKIPFPCFYHFLAKHLHHFGTIFYIDVQSSEYESTELISVVVTAKERIGDTRIKMQRRAFEQKSGGRDRFRASRGACYLLRNTS